MLRLRHTLALALLCWQTASASPALIVNGLEALRAGHPERATNLWLGNSLLRHSEKFEQIKQQLVSVRQLCGRFESWHPLHSQSLGARTRDLVFVLHFEHCPMFARFTVYEGVREASLVRLGLNSNPEFAEIMQ